VFLQRWHGFLWVSWRRYAGTCLLTMSSTKSLPCMALTRSFSKKCAVPLLLLTPPRQTSPSPQTQSRLPWQLMRHKSLWRYGRLTRIRAGTDRNHNALFSGKQLSRKVTLRETSHRETSILGKCLLQETSFWEMFFLETIYREMTVNLLMHCRSHSSRRITFSNKKI